MSGLRLPAAGAAPPGARGTEGLGWPAWARGWGSGSTGWASARCSPSSAEAPLPPLSPLLFLLPLFWERLHLLYLGLEFSMHLRGMRGGRQIKRLLEAPPPPYPASELPRADIDFGEW